MTHTETPLDTICRWWSTMNSWEWPDDFPIPKPKDFDALPYKSKDQTFLQRIFTKEKPDKYTVLSPYMHALAAITTLKQQLRYCHTHEMGITDDEFEVWWEENSEQAENVNYMR